MEITIDSGELMHIVHMSGRLDSTTVPEAQDTVMPLLTEGCCIVFDLSRCDMISSAGLRILLMFAKQIKKMRGMGVISGLTEEVKDVMEMTGFGNIFKVFVSVKEAVIAIGKGTV